MRFWGLIVVNKSHFKLRETMFGSVGGFLLLLFLPSVLVVDRGGWELLLIDFDPLEKREEPWSLDMLHIFPCLSICARGACIFACFPFDQRWRGYLRNRKIKPCVNPHSEWPPAGGGGFSQSTSVF